MKTLAQALIERRYLEQGRTTRVVVLPLPHSGLPEELIEAGQPVSLDILSGRPVNLHLDREGLAVDLCFTGPPVRCSFPWEAVVAAQSPTDDLIQTLVVTVASVMEDGSLQPTKAQLPDEDEAPAEQTNTPAMAVLKGEGKGPARRVRHQRPRLQLVSTSSRDAGDSPDPP